MSFFGIPASTITATERLAHSSGVQVVPLFRERLPGTTGYRLRPCLALENLPTADEAADTQVLQ